ncbi:hypothetical protein RQP46_008815 [Phenoliferia psychrophenolica]
MVTTPSSTPGAAPDSPSFLAAFERFRFAVATVTAPARPLRCEGGQTWESGKIMQDAPGAAAGPAVKTEEEIKAEAKDCQRCPIVRFMLQHVALLPPTTPLSAAAPASSPDLPLPIACRPCPPTHAGGYSPSLGILICQNRIMSKDHMEDALAHELVHAWDGRRFEVKGDWGKDLRAHACTEIRAENLSGDCRAGREWRRMNFGLAKQHQACVRRRAILSVAANPNCKSNDEAERAVNEVWESCFADTRPFDEVLPDALDSLASAIEHLPASTPPGPLANDIFEHMDPDEVEWPVLISFMNAIYKGSFTAADVRGGDKGVVVLLNSMRNAGEKGLGNASEYLGAHFIVRTVDQAVRSYIRENDQTRFPTSSTTATAQSPAQALKPAPPKPKPKPKAPSPALKLTEIESTPTPSISPSESGSPAPPEPYALKLRSRAVTETESSTSPSPDKKRRGSPSKPTPTASASKKTLATTKGAGRRTARAAKAAAGGSQRVAIHAPVLIKFDYYGWWPAVVLDPQSVANAWWRNSIHGEPNADGSSYLIKSLPLGSEWGWYDPSLTKAFDPDCTLVTFYEGGIKAGPEDKELFKEGMDLAADFEELDRFLQTETDLEGDMRQEWETKGGKA